MRSLLALLAPLALALGLACKPQPPPRGDEAPVPALDPAAMDRTVPACEDFYAYACGGWIASTPVPPDRLSFQRGAGELAERNARALRRIMEDARAGKGDPRDKVARKAGDFYAACMDEAAVDARGLADLLAEWAAVDAIRDRGELVAEIAHLTAMGFRVPFALGTAPPGAAGARTELLLAQDGLTLPDPALYLDEAVEPVRELYVAHLRAMLALAGVPTPDADAQAAAVLALERSLAPFDGGPLRAPGARGPAGRPPGRARPVLSVDRAGLQRLAPTLPWASFFQGVGIAWPETISLADPDGLSRGAALLEQAPLESWKAYLRWRVTDAMAAARALPARLATERFRFQGATFGGPPYQRPRWKDCVTATERALGPALGELFVRRALPQDRRDRSAHLAADVVRALDAGVRGLAWMDEPTRARAREKLSRLAVRTGGPEPAKDDGGALRVDRDSYFHDVLSAGRLELKRRLDLVGRPADREWIVRATGVEVAYDPVQNALLLPAGVLQAPFFEVDAPEELPYGAGGTAVGEALVGVLDPGTVRRDGDGGVREWWSPRTIAQFDAVAACLAGQAGGAPPDVEVSATVLEQLAEEAGVQLAWAALQAARAGRPATRKVHGLNPDQQFFVAYAQARCTARREDDRTHGRSMRARINGALSAAPAFAAAFGCKEGAPMVRPQGAGCGEW